MHPLKLALARLVRAHEVRLAPPPAMPALPAPLPAGAARASMEDGASPGSPGPCDSRDPLDSPTWQPPRLDEDFDPWLEGNVPASRKSLRAMV